MTFRYVATILIGLLAVSVPAGATILEGHVVGNIYFRSTAPDTTVEIGPVNTLVGPGVELTNFANFLTIDLSDTNILITATRSAATLTVFELLRFADVNGTIPAITGVTINSATNFAGLNASDITFTADLIDINLTGLPAQAGQIISLDLTASASPAPVTIPEPRGFALMALGVGIVALWRRLA